MTVIPDTAMLPTFGDIAGQTSPIKLDLDGPTASHSTGDFTVQVIIEDRRTGERHDTGPQSPTAVP